jgi:hypothetical protein
VPTIVDLISSRERERERELSVIVCLGISNLACSRPPSASLILNHSLEHAKVFFSQKENRYLSKSQNYELFSVLVSIDAAL